MAFWSLKAVDFKKDVFGSIKKPEFTSVYFEDPNKQPAIVTIPKVIQNQI